MHGWQQNIHSLIRSASAATFTTSASSQSWSSCASDTLHTASEESGDVCDHPRIQPNQSLPGALHDRCVSSLAVANQHRNYFGERESACVFTSRRCFSTTRRNSRSIVLKASWMTLLRVWCGPLSFCFSSATSS